MPTVTELMEGRVGYTVGVTGIQGANRVFVVETDVSGDDPVTALFESANGVVLGQSYPWAIASGIVALSATVSKTRSKKAHEVTVRYGVPLVFPDGGWRRRFRGALQTEDVTEAFEIDPQGNRNAVGIGPHWYILQEKLAQIDPPPPVTVDVYDATVLNDDGIPTNKKLRRLSGINDRRREPIPVRRPVYSVSYETRVSQLSKNAERQAGEYTRYTNEGVFDGFTEDQCILADINIDSSPGQIDGQPVTGYVHDISLTIDIDLKGHQPIDQADTYSTGGLRSYIRDELDAVVKRTYYPYLDNDGGRRNYVDLLNIFSPFRFLVRR